MDDIERQLAGNWRPDQVIDKRCRPQGPAQKRLVQALTAPSDGTLEGQYRRRDNAIDAVIAYCIVEEGQTVRRTNTSSTEPNRLGTSGDTLAKSPLQIAKTTIFVKTERERPRRCFVCIGKALSWRLMIRPWRTSSASFTQLAIYLSTSGAGTYPICGTAAKFTVSFVRHH